MLDRHGFLDLFEVKAAVRLATYSGTWLNGHPRANNPVAETES